MLTLCSSHDKGYLFCEFLKTYLGLFKYKVIYIVVIILHLSSSDAAADIVVLNLNDNESTVKTIIDYALNNNLRTVVYPNENIGEVNNESIKVIVNELENYDIDTLIISGHYTPGAFSGKNGELKQKKLLDSIIKSTKLKESIKHLVLRGCYTTRINEILKGSEWRQSLTNLNYIAGYDGRAWSSETVLSRQFVYDALKQKQAFLNSSSADDLAVAFENIRNHTQSSLAIWTKTNDNEYYISTKSLGRNNHLVDFKKINFTCSLNHETRIKYNELVKKYDDGVDPGFERPPSDTDKGSMRRVYEWLLKNQHCITLQVWDRSIYDDANKAAGLLFFDRLTHNYQNIYNQSEFRQLLDSYNEVADTKIIAPELSEASRFEIKSFVYQLGTEFYNKMTNGLIDKLDSHTIKRIEYHLSGMNKHIINIDPLTTPQNWLTDKNSYATPLFH